MINKEIKLKKINIFCSCGNEFNLNLFLDSDRLNIEVCNKCHPFYTGKQKIIDVSGSIMRYSWDGGSVM